MRVITGSAKGLPLKVPPLVSRPTTDRVKEAIFSILGNVLESAKVLDLFAGSGALGIEALSRGANDCVFVERDRQAVQVIKENLKKTRLETRARVIQSDVFAFVKNAQDFDLVFADPPYADDGANLATDLLAASDWGKVLKKNGLLVIECEARGDMPTVENIELLIQRDYGRSRVLIFKNPD